MLNGLQALILGIVEGFTEFLPISSTAHLILTARILGIQQSGFAKTFEIAIQSGAILAVLSLYWRKFLDKETLKKIVFAFLPTGTIGLLAYKFAKDYLLENIEVVLFALAAGGILLILFEMFFESKLKNKPVAAGDASQELTYRKSFWIGVFQAIAIIPGVSRAAATVIGGMFLGLRRDTIVEFSFLLAVPTMLAATGLDIFRNLDAFSVAEAGTLAIGLVAAFGTALLSIKFLLRYIQKHTFTPFGVYRLLLVVLFLLLVV